MDDIRDTLDARGNSYGEFKHNAFIAQTLKLLWRTSVGYSRLQHDSHSVCQDSAVINEGLEMILMKISRICNGDPKHLDSWIDIIGYAQLVTDHLHRCEKGEKV
jgi:hypothetical protein